MLKKSLPPLLVIAEDFGYGSAGKLASVVERLECDVVLVGSDHAEHVIPEERILDSHPDARTAGSIASVASEYDAHLALISNTHPLSSEASSAGLNTIFVDSLPFLWTEKDPVFHDPDVYCAQLCTAIPELSWTTLRRIRHLVWVEAVIGSTPPRVPAAQTDSFVLLNFGGVATHLLPLEESAYPALVLEAALEAIEATDHKKVVVTGNLHRPHLEPVLERHPKLDVALAPADHASMMKLLGQCEVLLTSPGLTMILEAGAADVPTILLPPQNVSQFLNADWVRTAGGDRGIVEWPQSVISREQLDEVRWEGEDAALEFVYGRISEAGASAKSHVAVEVRRALSSPHETLRGVTRYIEVVGSRGAEQVAAHVQELLRRPDVPVQRAHRESLPIARSTRSNSV